MAVMSRYCKAYPVTALTEFNGWNPKPLSDDKDAEEPLHPDYVFLQEDYTVTRGVFVDEQVVFDEVTPEWRRFCQEVLQFTLPDFTAIEEEAAAMDPTT